MKDGCDDAKVDSNGAAGVCCIKKVYMSELKVCWSAVKVDWSDVKLYTSGVKDYCLGVKVLWSDVREGWERVRGSWGRGEVDEAGLKKCLAAWRERSILRALYLSVLTSPLSIPSKG